MKTMCRLLVIAAVCCFAPAMSGVIKDGKDEKSFVAENTCLDKALSNNEKAAECVLDLICTHMGFQDNGDKEKLIKAIKNLQDMTDCSTKDLFGTSKSPEQLVMDESDVLSSQIRAMKKMLKQCDGSWSIPVICFVRNAMFPDSVAQSSKGEDGQGNKRIARNIVGNLVPGLLNPVLGLLPALLGGGGCQKQGYGAGGGNGRNQGGLLDLGGTLGGLTNTIGGITGGLLGGGGGGNGLVGGLTGGLLGGNGLLGGLLGGGGNGLVGGLTGGLLGGNGLLGGLLGGGGNGLVGGLTGGLLGGNGLLGGLLGEGGNGGLLGGLLGGGVGNGGLVGGMTGGLLGGGGGGNGGLLAGLL